MEEEVQNKRHKKIVWIVMVAIFAGLSTVLYFLKFSLPFMFPGFLKIQFSNLPIIMIGFLLGPWAGVATLAIKSLIALPFTSSVGVGELADFILGLGVSLSSSLIYKFNHTKKGAIIALVVSLFVWIILGVLANWLILIPFYIELYFHGDVNALVGALGIIKGINTDNYMLYYLLFAVIPFNALISFLVNLVTYFTYKRISTFLHSKVEF